MSDPIRRVRTKWVEAWTGGDGSTVSGWVVCALVETYKDGDPNSVLTVEKSKPRYCHEESELATLHRIYMIAERELMR